MAYLKEHYPALTPRIHEADFLRQDLSQLFPQEPLAIIGNFPYNISSQIFFQVLAQRQQVREVVGMLQKEVAERLAEPPGSKTYGILSVLLQAYYDVEFLFTVPPHVFVPPPKVESAVVRLTRKRHRAPGLRRKAILPGREAGLLHPPQNVAATPSSRWAYQVRR